MRDESTIRAESRWLVERVRVALDLPLSAVVGCGAEQIAQVLDAQEISALPPALDEFLRVTGIMSEGSLLSEWLGWTGVGWDTMLDAKDHARETAAFGEIKVTFGAGSGRLPLRPGRNGPLARDGGARLAGLGVDRTAAQRPSDRVPAVRLLARAGGRPRGSRPAEPLALDRQRVVRTAKARSVLNAEPIAMRSHFAAKPGLGPGVAPAAGDATT
jgi:hypothetical protein